MTLLEKHLEQIELCSSTIQELPFPPPRVFTNAMLRNRDITALIRDTEDHERALFELAPATDPLSQHNGQDRSKRRVTTFSAPDPVIEKPLFQAPRRGTAVAAVLGGDLHDKIRREYSRDAHDSQHQRSRENDPMDVDVLLKGAERLCSV